MLWQLLARAFSGATRATPRATPLTLAAALLASSSAGAAAQEPVRWEFNAGAGLHVPTASFGPSLLADIPWDFGRIGPALAGVATLELSRPGWWLRPRVDALLSWAADTEAVPSCSISAEACPLLLVHTTVSAGTAALTAGFTLSETGGDGERRYLILGAGFRAYRFSWGDIEHRTTAGEAFVLRPLARGGLGVEWPMFDRRVRVELTDLFTPGLGETADGPRRHQHDLALTLAVPVTGR